MQDTFQWTDELVQEFVQFTLHQSPAFQGRYTDMEQFKSSKSPKKEWEIVEVFCEGSDPVPAYQPEGWTKEWVEGQIKLGGLQIHSVRRLSDGAVFTKNEVVKTPSDGQHHIGGFEIRGNSLYAQFSVGQISIEYLQKLPQPILTTVDGIEITSPKEEVWVTFFDHSFAPYSASHAQINFYNEKIFSTREAAEQYILENKPLLSLNDVKEKLSEWVAPGLVKFVIGSLTALVKQKLNQ